MVMKHYPPEFRAEAVALYRSRPGVTIRSVAEDLGVTTRRLHRPSPQHPLRRRHHLPAHRRRHLLLPRDGAGSVLTAPGRLGWRSSAGHTATTPDDATHTSARNPRSTTKTASPRHRLR